VRCKCNVARLHSVLVSCVCQGDSIILVHAFVVRSELICVYMALHGVHLHAPCPVYHGLSGRQHVCADSTTLHLVKMLPLSAAGIKLVAFRDSGGGCLVQLSLGVRCAHMRLTLSCCRTQGTTIVWRWETETNELAIRYGHSSDVYAGRLWVFGGLGGGYAAGGERGAVVVASGVIGTVGERGCGFWQSEGC
jgi:hypothetical protein